MSLLADKIDRQDYLRWMDVHRCAAVARLLCTHEGVGIVQAEEEEIRGMWDWRRDGHACEHSFETDDDAMLDAYERLDLPQRALDGVI